MKREYLKDQDLKIKCKQCNADIKKNTNHIRKSLRLGRPLFCNKVCFGLFHRDFRRKKEPYSNWPTLRERFENNIYYGIDGCWHWIGNFGKKDYGQITKGNTTLRAHRVSYEFYKGPITDGLHVLHTCDNPSCVNPDHLFLGTNRDNVNDRIAKGRQGHKLKPNDVIQIRQILPTHRDIDIGKMFGVSRKLINNIRNKKIWKGI